MNLEKEFQLALERVAVQANRRYMEAIARIYQVDIRTVWIWHVAGKV